MRPIIKLLYVGGDSIDDIQTIDGHWQLDNGDIADYSKEF